MHNKVQNDCNNVMIM